MLRTRTDINLAAAGTVNLSYSSYVAFVYFHVRSFSHFQENYVDLHFFSSLYPISSTTGEQRPNRKRNKNQAWISFFKANLTINRQTENEVYRFGTFVPFLVQRPGSGRIQFVKN